MPAQSSPATATTPVTPRPHGIVPRGLEETPSSSTTTGRFGRMFRHLPVYEQQPKSLAVLGESMIQGLEDGKLDEPLGTPDDDENTSRFHGRLRLPAGYTYFGQFVDHDITFDPVSSLTRQNDPNALVDFRTPRFDLDSLYGRGPSDQPYLYEQDHLRLALGRRVSEDPRVAGPDLQRVATERAIIGDPRNDENLIVSQLQVAFIKFHNAVVEELRGSATNDTNLFKAAQQTVRWHYQWVVVHDFLRRLVGDAVVDDILRQEEYVSGEGLAQASGPSTVGVTRPRLLFYRWKEQPFMPVEFSVAAYRFGHSMARPSYAINDVIPLPLVPNANRIPFFSNGPRGTRLNGFEELFRGWGVQWKYFLPDTLDAGGPNDGDLPQPSYKLDAQLSNPLGHLPPSVATPEPLVAGFPAADATNLAVRNLLRGLRLGLPAGQDVARAMGIAPIGNNDLLGDVRHDGQPLDHDVRRDLDDHTPLWFYVLKEAQLLTGSAHLGPVGGRIVAEVLIGLLTGDPLSFLSVDPGWKPFLAAAAPEAFTLSDIVSFPARRGGQGRSG